MSVPTNCIAELRIKYNYFSPKVRMVANFIISYPETVLRCSIVELAKRVGVSQYSVLNCIRAIGFHGYTDFKIALSKSMNASESGIQQFAQRSKQSVLVSTLARNIRSLRDTAELISDDVFSSVITQIASARRISLYGLGYSSYAADYLCLQFIRLGLHASVQSDARYQLLDMHTLTSEDLLIGFSTAGDAPSIIEGFQTAQRIGCPTVAITSAPKSDMARFADYQLLTTSSTPNPPDMTNSIIEQISVCSAISSALVEHKIKEEPQA